MQITITATLTPEQVIVLSTQKGYQDSFQETNVETNEVSTYQNPQSREDFIRQVYEGMIIGDASRVFIDFANKQKEAERIAQENAIRESVTSQITSSVGA